MTQLPGRTMALDVWSTRERLCLASSVLRSGDQNWVSVSRALKPFGEPNRPADWFSQKNCALQYSDLLEKVETPKRKRGERTEIETPGECIVRKLTLERIDELKKLVVDERLKYRKLKDELETVRSGQADDRVPTIWAEIMEEKKARAEAGVAHQKWLQERELAKQAAAAALRMGKFLPVAKKAPPESANKKPLVVGRQNSWQSEQGDVAEEIQDIIDVTSSTEESSPQRTPDQAAPLLSVCTTPIAAVPPPPHHSPLLNNLLRNNNASPSFAQQQHPPPTPPPMTPATTPPLTSSACTTTTTKEVSPRSQLSMSSPTITSLLSSTTGMSTSLSSTVVNLFTTALGGSQAVDGESSDAASGQLTASPTQQQQQQQQGLQAKKRPSQVYTLAGAPTLLKLLDMPLGASGILPPLPILTTEDLALATNTTTMVDADISPSPAANLVAANFSSSEAAATKVTEENQPVTTFESEHTEDQSCAVAIKDKSEAKPDSGVAEKTKDTMMDDYVVKLDEVCKESTDLKKTEKQEEVDNTDVVKLEVPVGQESLDKLKPDESSSVSAADNVGGDVVVGNATEDVDVKQEVVVDSGEIGVGGDVCSSDDAIIVVDVTGNDLMESTTIISHEEVETNVDESVIQSAEAQTKEENCASSSLVEQIEESDDTCSSEEADKPTTVAVDAEPSSHGDVAEVDLPEEIAKEDVIKTAAISIESVARYTKQAITKDNDIDGEKLQPDAGGAVAKTQGDDEEGGAVVEDDDEDSNSHLSSTTNESNGPKPSVETSVPRSTRNSMRSLRGRITEQNKEEKTTAPTTPTEATPKEAETKRTSMDDGGRSTRLTRSRRDNLMTTTTTMTTTITSPSVAPRKREPSSRGKEHFRREESDAVRKMKDESLEGSGREDDAGGAIVSGSSHTIDSLPNSPSSTIFSDDPESTRDYKLWKKSIMLVWRAAANHKYANVFLHAVTEEMAPGYRSVVYRPMDLITIKKNIENGAIKTTAEFQRDVMLLFQNAIMYNNSDHDVYQMAIEMQKEVLPHIQDYLATQLMVQSAVPPKALRSRVDTRDQLQQQSSQFKRGTSSSATTVPDVATDGSIKSIQSGGREEIGEQAIKKRKRASSSDVATTTASTVESVTTPHQQTLPAKKLRRTRADDQ